MMAKKLTKEEQDIKLKKAVLNTKKSKPRFWEYVLHDPEAFKVVYLMGTIGGLIVTILLLGISLILDFHILFNILFGIMFITQVYNTYNVFKNKKYIHSSINDLAYQGKYDKSKYETKKLEYKGVPQ